MFIINERLGTFWDFWHVLLITTTFKPYVEDILFFLSIKIYSLIIVSS